MLELLSQHRTASEICRFHQTKGSLFYAGTKSLQNELPASLPLQTMARYRGWHSAAPYPRGAPQRRPRSSR